MLSFLGFKKKKKEADPEPKKNDPPKQSVLILDEDVLAYRTAVFFLDCSSKGQIQTVPSSSLAAHKDGKSVVVRGEVKTADGTLVRLCSVPTDDVYIGGSIYTKRLSPVVRSMLHGYNSCLVVTGDPTAKYALLGLATSRLAATSGGFSSFPNAVPKALGELLQGVQEVMDREGAAPAARSGRTPPPLFRIAFQAFRLAGDSVYDLQARTKSRAPAPSRQIAQGKRAEGASPSPSPGPRPEARPAAEVPIASESSWDITPGSDIDKLEDALVNHLDHACREGVRASEGQEVAATFLVWRLTRVWGPTFPERPKDAEGETKVSGSIPLPPLPIPGGESSVYLTVLDLPVLPEGGAADRAPVHHLMKNQLLALEQVMTAFRKGHDTIPFRISPLTEALGRYAPPSATKLVITVALGRENRTHLAGALTLAALRDYSIITSRPLSKIDKAAAYHPTPPANYRPKEPSAHPWAKGGSGLSMTVMERLKEASEAHRASKTGAGGPRALADTSAIGRLLPDESASSWTPVRVRPKQRPAAAGDTVQGPGTGTSAAPAAPAGLTFPSPYRVRSRSAFPAVRPASFAGGKAVDSIGPAQPLGGFDKARLSLQQQGSRAGPRPSSTPGTVASRPRARSVTPERLYLHQSTESVVAKRDDGLRRKAAADAKWEKDTAMQKPKPLGAPASTKPTPRPELVAQGAPYMGPTLSELARLRERSQRIEDVNVKEEQERRYRMGGSGWRAWRSSATEAFEEVARRTASASSASLIPGAPSSILVSGGLMKQIGPSGWTPERRRPSPGPGAPGGPGDSQALVGKGGSVARVSSGALNALLLRPAWGSSVGLPGHSRSPSHTGGAADRTPSQAPSALNPGSESKGSAVRYPSAPPRGTSATWTGGQPAFGTPAPSSRSASAQRDSSGYPDRRARLGSSREPATPPPRPNLAGSSGGAARYRASGASDELSSAARPKAPGQSGSRDTAPSLSSPSPAAGESVRSKSVVFPRDLGANGWTAPSPTNSPQGSYGMQFDTESGLPLMTAPRSRTGTKYAHVPSSGYGKGGGGRTGERPNSRRLRLQIPGGEPDAGAAEWERDARDGRLSRSVEQSPRDLALSHPAYQEARQPIDPEDPSSPSPSRSASMTHASGPSPSADTGSPSFGTKSTPGTHSPSRFDRDVSDEFSFPPVAPAEGAGAGDDSGPDPLVGSPVAAGPPASDPFHDLLPHAAVTASQERASPIKPFRMSLPPAQGSSQGLSQGSPLVRGLASPTAAKAREMDPVAAIGMGSPIGSPENNYHTLGAENRSFSRTRPSFYESAEVEPPPLNSRAPSQGPSLSPPAPTGPSRNTLVQSAVSATEGGGVASPPRSLPDRSTAGRGSGDLLLQEEDGWEPTQATLPPRATGAQRSAHPVATQPAVGLGAHSSQRRPARASGDCTQDGPGSERHSAGRADPVTPQGSSSKSANGQSLRPAADDPGSGRNKPGLHLDLSKVFAERDAEEKAQARAKLDRLKRAMAERQERGGGQDSLNKAFVYYTAMYHERSKTKSQGPS